MCEARVFGRSSRPLFPLSPPRTRPSLPIQELTFPSWSPTAINYRLAPETRFPGPLHDAVSAYFRLIDDLKIPPENILFAGDSAGGGLSLALLMYLRDNGECLYLLVRVGRAVRFRSS